MALPTLSDNEMLNLGEEKLIAMVMESDPRLDRLLASTLVQKVLRDYDEHVKSKNQNPKKKKKNSKRLDAAAKDVPASS